MDYIIKRDEKIKPWTPIFIPYFSVMALTLSVYQFLEVSTRGKLQKQVTLNLEMWQKQGKSEGFDSCDRPSNLKLD